MSSQKSTIECSIIVVSYNTRDLTVSCIRNIIENPPRFFFEIILVDNDSQDGTSEEVKKWFPKILRIKNQKNVGFSKACNRGAMMSSGRILLFLNSDTEPKGEAFDQLFNWLNEHEGTGIVGPELVGPENEIIQMSWGWNPVLMGEILQQTFAPYRMRVPTWRRKWVKWLQRRPRHVPIVCGACLMMRREVFERLKGFDEDFELYFEDSDLCWRCNELGLNVDFFPGAKVLHRLSQSTKGTWTIPSLIYRQSQIAFYRKHASSWAIPLLKFYLTLKLVRLYFVILNPRVQRKRAMFYVRKYREIISESGKVLLTEKLPV